MPQKSMETGSLYDFVDGEFRLKKPKTGKVYVEDSVFGKKTSYA